VAKLEVRNLNVHYVMTRTQQRIQALEGVSFDVDTGEFLAVVGPSGCGKSSLLNVIAGLVSPGSGSVRLNGVPVTSPGRDRAMVFQAAALLPWRTVLANVSYGLELQGIRADEARTRARRLIGLVGLHGFEESFPRELSGGMQQRANLARALAVEPELLLLDEPLAALDAQTREYMQNELQRIWIETRHTAILVTHQIREAVYLADRVAVLTGRPGRIQALIPIPLARPRSERTLQDPDFHALELEIWKLLHSQIDASDEMLFAGAR
jgi:NitT/TauT family transport system ATP-binding protein